MMLDVKVARPHLICRGPAQIADEHTTAATRAIRTYKNAHAHITTSGSLTQSYWWVTLSWQTSEVMCSTSPIVCKDSPST
eukprot:29398-Eustigmatos_ZCMA.PRE.1